MASITEAFTNPHWIHEWKGTPGGLERARYFDNQSISSVQSHLITNKSTQVENFNPKDEKYSNYLRYFIFFTMIPKGKILPVPSCDGFQAHQNII